MDLPFHVEWDVFYRLLNKWCYGQEEWLLQHGSWVAGTTCVLCDDPVCWIADGAHEIVSNMAVSEFGACYAWARRIAKHFMVSPSYVLDAVTLPALHGCFLKEAAPFIQVVRSPTKLHAWRRCRARDVQCARRSQPPEEGSRCEGVTWTQSETVVAEKKAELPSVDRGYIILPLRVTTIIDLKNIDTNHSLFKSYPVCCWSLWPKHIHKVYNF